jgi:signal transduction histidine kinase
VTRRRLSLRAWLLLSYLVVFSLAWIAIIGSGALAHDLRAQTREHLTAQGHLWALRIAAELARPGGAELPMLADALERDLAASRDRTLCAVQVVDDAGIVLASSSGHRGQILADDPEVAAALEGGIGATARDRPRVRGNVDYAGPSRFAPIRLFVAVPIEHDSAVVGAVVMSRTPREDVQAFVQMGPRLGVALLVVVAFTFAMAMTSGHFGSRSLAQLADAARRIAGGSRDRTALLRLEQSRVAEVGALAGAVAAMHGQLQARLDYIDEFAGNVAHEFRTPIATLRGTFELLQDDPGMSGEQRERFMANAQAELSRLESLVSGLLALARAERTEASHPVDLVALAERAAHRHGVRVEGSCRSVLGSARQLESVLDNLIDNATRHAGPDAEVTVRLADVGQCAAIEVIDDGPGIAPADLPRVFDRFFTTDRKRGTGLGLALVQLVARAHGGDVQAHSVPGRTVFTVTLPAAP